MAWLSRRLGDWLLDMVENARERRHPLMPAEKVVELVFSRLRHRALPTPPEDPEAAELPPVPRGKA